MPSRAVQVECYAGGRADERPRRVCVGKREYRVAQLLSTWVEEAFATKAQVRGYRVLTEDQWILNLTCTSDGHWTLESKRRMIG
jgi:hypothetical protein